MSRIQPLVPESAVGNVKLLLDAVKHQLGLIPNMTRVMANAPVVLEAYLTFNNILGQGILSSKEREQIALAVSEANGSECCLAMHSAMGKMAGLTPNEIDDSRRGIAVNSKTDALIRLARKVVDTRGRVSNSDLNQVRAAGFSDSAIAEVVAQVVRNIFTNYFNSVFETDLDFPGVPPLSSTVSETTTRDTLTSTYRSSAQQLT